MKHTKEPWKFSKSDTGRFYCQGDINSESFEVVFDCEDIKQSDADRIEDCVNACEGIKPIAVPDLLEACRHVLQNHKHNREGHCWELHPNSIELIRNAIAKAEEK